MKLKKLVLLIFFSVFTVFAGWGWLVDIVFDAFKQAPPPKHIDQLPTPKPKTKPKPKPTFPSNYYDFIKKAPLENPSAVLNPEGFEVIQLLPDPSKTDLQNRYNKAFGIELTEQRYNELFLTSGLLKSTVNADKFHTIENLNNLEKTLLEIASKGSVALIVGHNENGIIKNGVDEFPIKTIETLLIKNQQLAVFLSCKSNDYLKTCLTSGVDSDIDMYSTSILVNKIIKNQDALLNSQDIMNDIYKMTNRYYFCEQVKVVTKTGLVIGGITYVIYEIKKE